MDLLLTARRMGAGATVRILAVILALAVLSACGKSTTDPAALRLPKGTPVVLISIDTLRADHLPMYGYQGVETPALAAFRKEALLCERAYAVTPLTLPSHSTLLSGLLPGQHGVRDNVGYPLDKAKIKSGALPFLPQILKRQGYATGGAVSAYVLQGKSGLSTGFDFYEDGIEFKTGTGLGGLQRPGGETLRLALPWLRGVADKPFFLFFHLYEPHTPYQPPEPFASRYKSRYDGEIAAADQIVGELFAELKKLGVYDRALIFVLADHGEGLGDHGEDEHGVLLYQEAIRVPLLVKLPQGRLGGETVARPAALLDVAPTVLSLLGLPVPAALHGVSLPSLLAAGAPVRRIYSETFYPRLHFGWSDLASLTDDRHQYIEGPDPELYAILKDPGEKKNVLRDERRVYGEMRQALAGYDRALAPPAAVDEESRRAMQALGYLGSGSGAAGGGPWADPKAQIGSLTDLKVGFRQMAEQRFPEAAATFQKVIAQSPKMVDAWEFLGRAREKIGQNDAALAAYREALKISNGSAHIAVAAASLYFAEGDLEQAAAHARLAVQAHPSFAHGLLAQIALRKKDLDTAEREARLAMEDKELRLGPMITLAEVLHARGRYEEALKLTERAGEAYNHREAKDSTLIQGLSLIQGKILADLGDGAAAERALRQEIRLFPKDPRAYSNLAILLALTGRTAEVGPTLQTMVAQSPTPEAYAEAVKALRTLKDTASAERLLRYAQAKFPGSPALQGLGRVG